MESIKGASRAPGKTRGWLDVSGARMCLLDISGGWVNIVLSMMLFAGENTARRVLFEAGHSETFSSTAIQNGFLDRTLTGFREAVNSFSVSGFGDFTIRELTFSQGFAVITCRDTFEAWAFLQNRRHSESPVCHYSSGVLLSFMENVSGKKNLLSIETKCIANGHDECEFVIGTRAALKKRGIIPPEWGMTIKEKADYLENLLQEKERLHAEIKESESKYKSLVEEINDGYFLCQDGKVLYTNDAFLSMHGYTRDEASGKAFNHFLIQEYIPHAKKALVDHDRGKRVPERIEFNRKHRDGRELPTELKINLIEYRGRSAIIGIFSDISKRKEMERKIMDHARLASIGQFSAVMAHEIRNPLSAIKTNIQVLAKNPSFQGRDRRRIDIATGEIRRLDQLLEDILDFAAPVKLSRVSHDIREVILKCLELLGDRIADGQIRIVNKMARPIPAIRMNYEKMQQAILNILLNAIAAMPNGGCLIVETGHTDRLGKKAIRVEITDDGDGISPENMEKIFEPFFSHRTGGTGLGLSNVKKIVEAHEGRIEISSRPHHGTRVRLLLPVGGYNENTGR